MIVGERDDRIVVGEIVVKRQLKLHTRAVDEIPEKLILCSIANRQQDLYIVGHRLPRAIKYHDRDDPFTWIDCWIHRDGARWQLSLLPCRLPPGQLASLPRIEYSFMSGREGV
jgi:hypothetical protein